MVTIYKYRERLDDECVSNMRLARKAFLDGDTDLAYFWYRKNRIDHGLETYYEVDYPQHIKFIHPIGCVLGRATYGDYLVCFQGSGVGSTLDGHRPTLGTDVVLFPGARVLGNTGIGNNVFITANTVVQECIVPDNSVVFMGLRADRSYGAVWKPTKHSVRESFFK